jgi:prefoldin subunit 4
MANSVETYSEEIEVRAEDQTKINEFGKLNNRLLELRADVKQYKADAELIDDANTDMMMNSSGGKVMLLIGEAFVEVSEDYATEFCEGKSEELSNKVEAMMKEDVAIKERQEVLKKDLYARFGDSINLES